MLEYDKAIEAYKEAVRLDKNNQYAWRELGEAYVSNCQLDQANQVHQRLAKDYPRDFATIWLNESIQKQTKFCEMKGLNDILKR